jgi:hypothetical protein
MKKKEETIESNLHLLLEIVRVFKDFEFITI